MSPLLINFKLSINDLNRSKLDFSVLPVACDAVASDVGVFGLLISDLEFGGVQEQIFLRQ